MSSVSLRNRAALRRPQRLVPDVPRRAIAHKHALKAVALLPFWDDVLAKMMPVRHEVSADGRTVTRCGAPPCSGGMWVLPSAQCLHGSYRCRFRVVVESRGGVCAVGLISCTEHGHVLSRDCGSDFTCYPWLLVEGGESEFRFDIDMRRGRCSIAIGDRRREYRSLPDGVYLACALLHAGSCRIAPLQ